MTARVSGPAAPDLARRVEQLEAVADLAVRLGRAPQARDVATALLDTALRATDAPRGAVLAGPDGQLGVLAATALPEAGLGRPVPSPLVERAQASGRVLAGAWSAPEDEPWLARLLPDAPALLVAPLVAEGRPLGALVLEQPAAAPQDDEPCCGLLERCALLTALALRSAWQLEMVQRLAATDGLTKIANRRTLEATLERELARAVRGGESLSLVMLDIDHFKALNDTHGHLAGDEVLRNVAAALSCECRDFDTAARYGGEEFAVVLPGCEPEEALQIAERLRRAVAGAPAVAPVTASAGVASAPLHATDVESLVRAADAALYRSKRAGRDRSSTAEHPASPLRAGDLLRRAVLERTDTGSPAATPRRP